MGENGVKSYDDLCNITLIHDDSSLEDESCPQWHMWLKAVDVILPKKSRRIHFNTTQLTLEAAIAGRGVALAKGNIAKDDLQKGKLVRLFSRSLAIDFAYYIVCPNNRKDIAKVAAFIKWLRNEVKSDL